MKRQLVLLISLALGHLVVAKIGATPSLVERVMSGITETLSRGTKASPHIVGGTEVVPHSYPHQVFLLIRKENELLMCGGSLITPQWVLTAAHCIYRAKAIGAALGVHNWQTVENGTQILNVEKLIAHKDWNGFTNANDIALLKLQSSTILDEKVQTIRLPSLALKNKTLWRTPVTMAGWGLYSDKLENDFSPFLRAVESNIISNWYCNLKYRAGITDTMVCVDGSHGRGVCSGDSGGPLIMTEADGQRTLIGVTSFGVKFGCESGYPYGFTRVDHYLEWIASNIEIQLRQE